jgi:hypothetical protein
MPQCNENEFLTKIKNIVKEKLRNR